MAVADAAQGMLVAADVGDQAGAVRDLVAAFKRSPEATTTAAQDISRAWIPLLVAAVLLLLHTFTRRTTALAVLVLSLGLSHPVSAQGPRNAADDAWLRGDFASALAGYFQQVQDGEGGDTVLFNLGTAAMALGDSSLARTALGDAARSIEPDVRFRALFNLGLMELFLAESDSSNRVNHLEQARRYYREALLIRPSDTNAKWNLELTLELMPPESGSGGDDETPQPSPSESETQPAAPQGLSVAQAEQILNSIAEEERQTQERLNRRRSQLRETRGRKDW
jgi:tetratricopeptide (TPR) repeat protein